MACRQMSDTIYQITISRLPSKEKILIYQAEHTISVQICLTEDATHQDTLALLLDAQLTLDTADTAHIDLVEGITNA